MQLGIDYCAMAAAQKQDAKVQAYRIAASSLKLQDITFEGITILCDMADGYARPIVPTDWRRKFF